MEVIFCIIHMMKERINNGMTSWYSSGCTEAALQSHAYLCLGYYGILFCIQK